jgi:hypothetical protein
MTLINRTTNSIRTILAAAVLMAVPAGAVAVHAQDNSVSAKFTLPYQVRWNKTVLPAGEYTINFRSQNRAAVIRPVHGTQAFLTGVPMVGESNNKEDAGILVTNSAGQHIVRSMNLPELGVRYVFSPIPDTEREETAKAGEIVTVSVSAKR